MAATNEARLRIMPAADAREGQVIVAVATSGDAGGAKAELQRIRTALAAQPADLVGQWADANRRSAAEFWSLSRLTVGDPLIENLWYETLHARRCAYRRDTVPPGLFLPSTVQDYSHWHGDYHTNYNFQQPFWGDYTANHLELGDAYFRGMDFFLQIGRKIARDYYGTRGAFIQLSPKSCSTCGIVCGRRSWPARCCRSTPSCGNNGGTDWSTAPATTAGRRWYWRASTRCVPTRILRSSAWAAPSSHSLRLMTASRGPNRRPLGTSASTPGW
jgi:hypothetical protein